LYSLIPAVNTKQANVKKGYELNRLKIWAKQRLKILVLKFLQRGDSVIKGTGN